MRIALYARVSTKDKGQDHENQLRELRAFVTRRASDKWELAAEFVDKVSGKTAERPAFRRMFEAASRKEFDLVLFWSLDRFSREGVLETLQHLQRLGSYGSATIDAGCCQPTVTRYLSPQVNRWVYRSASGGELR